MADEERERLEKAVNDARLKVVLLRQAYFLTQQQEISLAIKEYWDSVAELSGWYARQPRGGREG